MVSRVIEQGWALGSAAAAADVSERTCVKRVAHYRVEGESGLVDRSSAPQTVPNRTEERRIEKIAALRRLRFTVPGIAGVLVMPALDGIGHRDADRDGQARTAWLRAGRALRPGAARRARPPAAPPTFQRKGRPTHPHYARRLGLRRALRHQPRTAAAALDRLATDRHPSPTNTQLSGPPTSITRAEQPARVLHS